MKIAVSAVRGHLDASVDPRFGRCAYFLIVDTDSMEFEAVENAAATAAGGAGIQAAQNVLEKGVDTLITGNCGPKAFSVLSTGGVKVFLTAGTTVREALDKLAKGELEQADGASVEGHWV